MPNWDEPIGLGKMGNNPYALAAAGGNLIGRSGLIPMLGSAIMGGTSDDPRVMQKFLAASEAQNAPVSEIPRQGLLPQLLAKAGILSPNMKASPYMMDLETLALRQQQSQKASDMLKAWTGLMDIAQKGGPGAAGQAYQSIPGMKAMFPTFDQSQIRTPEMVKGWYEQQQLKVKDREDRIRENQLYIQGLREQDYSQMVAAAVQRSDADMIRATAQAARGDQAKVDSWYHTVIGQYGSDARGQIGGTPAAAYARNFFVKAYANKISPDQAMIMAYADPNMQPALATAPAAAPEESSGFSLPSLSSIGRAIGYGATPTGAVATGATPYGSEKAIVPPRFSK